jgi:hypothetical protein
LVAPNAGITQKHRKTIVAAVRSPPLLFKLGLPILDLIVTPFLLMWIAVDCPCNALRQSIAETVIQV